MAGEIESAAVSASVVDALSSSQHRKAALTRWDKCPDRRAETKPMRDGLLRKLRDQVLKENPGLADEAEIENRIERKLKIKYETMRANSLKTRRANAGARRRAAAEALADAVVDAERAAGSDEAA